MKSWKVVVSALVPVLVWCLSLVAHAEPELGSLALHQALLDLGTDLRLMCVAAHPDDEDGATLAMYRKKYGYKTFALIATRGEGGQNEIGPELYNELGVIRTHEMMAASAITGAELHFLDMPEFGYSKSREEAYAVWGEEETLRRMVRKVRELRPDVIITHHPPTGAHGHHQAVGDTIQKAFDVAGDPGMFPEQIAEGLKPWHPSRLYVRTFRGDAGDAASFIGEMDSAWGYTYEAIAAQALWEHKSQGMGFFVDRFLTGRRTTHYNLVKESGVAMGYEGPAEASAIDAPGGELFRGLRDRVSAKARLLSSEADGTGRPGLSALDAILRDSAGTREWGRANRLAVVSRELGLRVDVDDSEVVPGQRITISAQLTDYGVADAERVTFSLESGGWVHAMLPRPAELQMSGKQEASVTYTVDIPLDLQPTIPHPEKLFEPHFLEAQFSLVARVASGGRTLELRAPVLVDVAPPVSAEFVEAPYLVREGFDGAVTANVLLTNRTPGAKTVTVSLSAAAGVSTSPKVISVDFSGEDDQKIVPVKLSIKKKAKAGDFGVEARIDETGFLAKGIVRVVELEVPEDIRVGVIESYDDTFMNTLTRLGVPHDALGVEDFTEEKLDRFSTIIVDIRAYLVRPDLVANNAALLEYVRRGGTVIVMYQKTFEWKKEFAPYPLQLGRNRVTLEDAPITVLEPKHDLFNFPNEIVAGDWDGWIQERGLYFPSRWDEKYTPLIDCRDPGESPPPGSVLIADYGRGIYMYTALGWYRQLRALHPGTLRIFANMLAL